MNIDQMKRSYDATSACVRRLCDDLQEEALEASIASYCAEDDGSDPMDLSAEKKALLRRHTNAANIFACAVRVLSQYIADGSDPILSLTVDDDSEHLSDDRKAIAHRLSIMLGREPSSSKGPARDV